MDDDLCVINKASGHVVHRTQGAGDSPIILQSLRDQLGKRIFPVHRLDRGTSGCLAFAFSSDIAAKLQKKLQDQSSSKKYICLCLGKLDEEGSIDRELFNEKKVKQEALTKYRLIKHYQNLSLLEVEIFTGRRNQIRRHLSFLGHHIIGDVNYGKGWLNRKYRNEYNFHRLFLHCHRLSFEHPRNNKKIEIHCELSPELNFLLKQID